MASAIAIVSVVSSAVVAVAVAILSARWARTQQLLQASITRLDELRVVIDTAALQLRDAIYDANGVWSLLEHDDPTNPPPKPVVAELEKHLNEMDDSKIRIDVRLGRSSELSWWYEASREPLWTLWDAFVGVLYQGRAFEASETDRLLKQAAEAKDRFLDAASDLLDPGLTISASSATRPKLGIGSREEQLRTRPQPGHRTRHRIRRD